MHDAVYEQRQRFREALSEHDVQVSPSAQVAIDEFFEEADVNFQGNDERIAELKESADRYLEVFLSRVEARGSTDREVDDEHGPYRDAMGGEGNAVGLVLTGESVREVLSNECWWPFCRRRPRPVRA